MRVCMQCLIVTVCFTNCSNQLLSGSLRVWFCQVSMWIDIREPTDQVLQVLNRAMSSPAVPSVNKEGISQNTIQLVKMIDEAQLSTSVWFTEAKQYMTNDMDNLHR